MKIPTLCGAALLISPETHCELNEAFSLRPLFMNLPSPQCATKFFIANLHLNSHLLSKSLVGIYLASFFPNSETKI